MSFFGDLDFENRRTAAVSAAQTPKAEWILLEIKGLSAGVLERLRVCGTLVPVEITPARRWLSLIEPDFMGYGDKGTWMNPWMGSVFTRRVVIKLATNAWLSPPASRTTGLPWISSTRSYRVLRTSAMSSGVASLLTNDCARRSPRSSTLALIHCTRGEQVSIMFQC